MSQFFVQGSGGGGGGITSVVGQSSLVAPTITVTTAGGVATVEDRAWETQYVVDPSTTPGLRGTFSTIQAAINQAVSDGASLSVQKQIFIRYGTYTENLTIPAGIFLQGEAMFIQPGAVSSYCIISGNHTLQPTNPFRCANLTFNNPSSTADLFTNSGATNIINAFRCTFNNASSTGLIATINFTLGRMEDCVFVGTQFQNLLSIQSSSNLTMVNCQFITQGAIEIINGSLNVSESQLGPISFSGGAMTAYNTLFIGSANCVTGTGTSVSFYDCGFDSSADSITFTGTILIAGIYQTGGGGAFYANNTASITPAQSGSVMPHVEVTSPYSASNNSQVIYCDTTSAAVSIVFSTGLCLDQTWIIKDWLGNASNHNITITVTGGALIDGSSSYVINQNYGSVTLQVTGNGNFITLAQSQPSAIISFAEQNFISSGTYTPNPLMVFCEIEAWGGGGGGGGVAGDIINIAGGSGGGGGTYTRGVFTRAQIGSSQTVTIGIAGTAGTNTGGAAGAGGTTSVGTLIISPGGSAGASVSTPTATGQRGGGNGGSSGTGQISLTGGAGTNSFWLNGLVVGGQGGVAGAGTGPSQQRSTTVSAIAAGNAGNFPGGGGGGGVQLLDATGAAGGAGSQGYVVITEYLS